MRIEILIKNEQLINGFMGTKYKHYRYEENWNQLMPVVEKIETIQLAPPSLIPVKVQIKGNSCRIFKGGWIDDKEGFIAYISYDTNKKQYTKIEATYLAVIEFIKWYNKQSKI
jgi:hypothetical protein